MTKLRVLKFLGTVSMTICVILIVFAQSAPTDQEAVMVPGIYKIEATLAKARKIGLSHDREQIQYLHTLLIEPPNSNMHVHVSIPPLNRVSLEIYPPLVALVALGRIADPQSIDLIQRCRPHLRGLESYMDVTIARIQATTAVPKVSSSYLLRQRIRYFLKALEAQGISRQQLQSVEARRFEVADPKVEGGKEAHYELIPIGIVALRTLTEITSEAYTAGVRDAFAVLRAEGFVWEEDYPSRLRIELAKLPKAQRVEFLWKRIKAAPAHQDWEIRYDMQAFIDLGEPARQYLLKQIDQLSQQDAESDLLVARLFCLLVSFRSSDTIELLARLESRFRQQGKDRVVSAIRLNKEMVAQQRFAGAEEGNPRVLAADW